MKKYKIVLKIFLLMLIGFVFAGVNLQNSYGKSDVFLSQQDYKTREEHVLSGTINDLTIGFFETTTSQTLNSEEPIFEAEYKAQNFVLQITCTHTTIQDFNYAWHYSAYYLDDTSIFEELSNQNTNQIALKNCSQSGFYFCRVFDANTPANYCDTTVIRFDITPKQLSITQITAQNRPYDGTTAVALNVELDDVFEDDDVACSLSGNVYNADASDQKYVYLSTPSLTGLSSQNYLLSSTMPADPVFVDITKKVTTLTWETQANSTSYTYNGFDQIGTISAYYYNLANEKTYLSFSFSGSAVFGTTRYYLNEFINTGTYKATIIMTTKEYNYDLKDSSGDATLTLYMNRATPIISINNTSFVYTGLLQNASSCATINNSEQTLIFSNNTFTTVSQGNSLTVSVSASQSLNYFSISSTFNISVLKANATINLTNVQKNFVFTGEAQTISSGAVLNNSEQTLVYSNNTFTTVSQGNNLTVQVYAQATENFNYVSSNFTITVSKANINTSGWSWHTSNFVYNGFEKTVFLSNYDNSLVTPFYANNVKTNVGNYVAKVSFVLSDSVNYNTVSFDSCEWTIEKASVTMPSATQFESYYTGAQQTLNLTTNPYYRVLNNSALNAGFYSLQVELLSITNTQWADGSTQNIVLNWEIKKAQIAMPCISELNFYNGRSQSIKLTESDLYTVICNAQTEIGQYQAYLILNDTQNYEWEGTTSAYAVLNWQIHKNTQNRPVSVLAIVLSALSILILAVYITLHWTVKIKRHRRKKNLESKKTTNEVDKK